jgi:Pyridoxamine 5'-phosphate oxidase
MSQPTQSNIRPGSQPRSASVGPWTDEVDEILDGDHAVTLAYVTPAGGVVLAPVSNFGLHDRADGILTVNSSVGAWKKLERIGSNPHVALVFHTRAHASHERPEYVLVQGRASLQPPVSDYPSSVLEHWERLEPWRDLGPLWKRWLQIYALRVEVRIAVERLFVWPDLACEGVPRIEGVPLPTDAPVPQRPPAKGTAPRVDSVRVARRVAGLPHALLGWVGADSFPFVVPVRVGAATAQGITLEVPEGTAPQGGRRAGLTAHWFSRGVVGQRQIICTGWMEGGPGQNRVSYSPHTRAAYRMPNSRFVYHVATGGFTRLRYRQAPPSAKRKAKTR